MPSHKSHPIGAIAAAYIVIDPVGGTHGLVILPDTVRVPVRFSDAPVPEEKSSVLLVKPPM